MKNLGYMYPIPRGCSPLNPEFAATYTGTYVAHYKGDRSIPHTEEEWLRTLKPLFESVMLKE